MTFPGAPAPLTTWPPGGYVFHLHRRSLVMPLISAVLGVGGLVVVALTGAEMDYRIGVILIGVVIRIVQVVTMRVVVTADRVRATWGWLWTSDKSIPLDRVQDVEIQRSLLARLLGLTQVEISSAGAGGSIKLSYFDLPDAERFRNLLVNAGLDTAPGVTGPAATAATAGVLVGPPLHAVTQLEILRTVLVSGTVAVTALVVGLVLAVIVHPVALLPGVALVVLVVAKWVATWLTIGPGETSRRGDLLHTRQGVVTLRNTNTPLRRIQILGSVAGPVYQLIGAEQVSFASADAAVAASERVRTQISPGARRGLADALVTPILGVGAPTPDRRVPLGDRLVRSNALRWGFAAAVRLPPVVVLAALVGAIDAATADRRDVVAERSLGAVALAVVVVAVAGALGAAWGAIRSGRSWVAIDEDCLVLHDGVWRLRTIAVPLAKVQAVDVTSDPAQRRCGTATFQVDVAGVSGRWAVKLPDLDLGHAEELRDRVVRVATTIALPDGV